ncbi:MAG: type II toxin-antitoxin system VapC family toxin [Synergistaceae bacterium]|nr:type II toxin-antitoxin system VapC family toxin [Synergistaceae bacterium]
MTVTYMLDTDICSYILREHPVGLKKVFRKYCAEAPVCISAITYAELLAGAAEKGSKHLEEKIAAFTSLLKIIAWTDSCARKYSIIKVGLKKAGTPIGNMDMMIAAAALAAGATLVTNNERHFRKIDGLDVINWLK